MLCFYFRKEYIMRREILLVRRNLATQEVLADGVVDQGSVYRRFFEGCQCTRPVVSEGTATTINATGLYKIEVEATFTAPAAGDVTLQLFENGVAIDGAFATETITTATTEVRSITFSTYVVVDQTRVLGITAFNPKSYTLVNTGVAATFTRVQVAVKNEV